MAKEGQQAGVEIDYDKLGAAIGKALGPAVGSAVGEAVKPLSEQLTKLQPAAAATAGEDKGQKNDGPKPLSLEDFNRLLDERDTKRQQDTARQADRQRFVEQHLAKLPAPYQGQLGNDPAKWDAEAKQIQASFEKDFTSRGGKVETVGGANRDGGDAANKAPVDHSKLPAFERLHLGLPPVPSAPAATAAGGEATAAGAAAAK